MTKAIMRVRSPILLVALSIAFFLLCDTVIFRSNIYTRFLKGNSVGTLAFRVGFQRDTAIVPGSKTLLLVGNSQLQRGFSQTLFEQQFGNSGVKLERLDASKTYEEVWYYALKYADPNHDKYNAILITLPDYKVEPFSGFGQSENYEMATFLAPFIDLRDWVRVLKDYEDTTQRRRAARLALLASHRYSLDLQDFLMHPLSRIQEYRYRNEKGNDWQIDPPFVAGEWRQLGIDHGNVIDCPAPYNHFDCVGAEAALQPIPADYAASATAHNTEYEKKWLGKIVDMYKGSRTHLIFVQMPRWPTTMPEREPIPGAPDIRDFFAGVPNVTFLDPDLLARFETPTLMYDHAHVSMAAIPGMTETLGAAIVKTMATIGQ
jgi:hypothetical protein